MLCLVTDLHCDPEGQASALAAWPKSLRQPGGKQDANSYPMQRDNQAVAGLEDRDQPGYPACGTGEGGEEVWEGQSAVPTPPHLGQWTKRPPARPEGVAEWGHTVAKRPPVIGHGVTFIEDVNKRGLRAAPPPPPLTSNPPRQKVFLFHVPWACNSAFSLICFAQLNFRGHPATSLCKGHDPGGRG